MSTPIITYDKRPVIVSPTAPTSLEQLRYLWLDISETNPVLRYYNNTGIWEAINNVDTSSFLTTNGVQTITGAKTFNTGTITVADITVDDVTIEGIDTIKLTDDDTHVPTSKLVEDTLVSAISGLETSIDGELATKANTADVVLKTDISTSIPSAGAVDTKVASEKAVADSLAAKQNTLKYYSEGTDTVTIETATKPNSIITVKAGAAGMHIGHPSGGGMPQAGFGILDGEEDAVLYGISVSNAAVNIKTATGFKINNSEPYATTIVEDINLQSGGEHELPTASAVRRAINQIKTDLGSALTYKGSVDTYDQLPEEAEVGDTWNVAQAYQTYPAGTNYAWTGSAWDALGGSVDLSGYQTKSDDTLATSAKTVVGAINEVNTALSNKQNKLLYYSETSGGTPSATITVANIKLSGKVAEGTNTTASGMYSHAEGSNTIASSNYQHAQGKYNIEDADNKYADIIGNGTSTSARSNAATVSWDGISWSQTDVRAGGTDQDSATHSLSAKQNATDNSLTTTDKTIVGAINEIENKVLDSHLSKLPYGTLYFDKGKLSGSNFAIPNFPFSICATVRIDEWQSDSSTQTIFQYGDYGSTTDPWCTLAFLDTSSKPQLRLTMLLLVDGAQKTTEINCDVNLSEFLGKMHTIIGICRAVTTEALNWDIYIDGAKQNISSSLKNVVVSSLSGTRNWAVNTSNYSYSNNPASANPMMLRNLYVFNFDVSAESSPYSIADYVAGRLIPPSLIGDQFTGMYGSGWSVSGDTATCSGTSTLSYPRITRGLIQSGLDFSFTLDIDLTFSGTPQFEIYTNCQRAYAEVYDYSTQLTTQKNSANGGGFYGNASLGITSSGHYKIKFDCKGSLGGKEPIQMAIGALTSGTMILSDTYHMRCNLALENYTIARNATTTLVKDASGNSNDATVTGNVFGDNDQSIKVFVDEIKTQTPLTSLQFNVYGTDKKIVPGKYMRLIFSQDSNGNVTPTYISEEEWNDVYDV
jgi:hypothetical protein